MLETLCVKNAAVSGATMVKLFHMEILQSNNASGAGNQQERVKIESWLVGFTDGEGCFSVSLIKNKTSKSGWQVFPEFVITQGKKSLPALELFQKHFQCGKIFVNKRYDNHREHIYRYCVRSIVELNAKIIPFFQKNSLRTAKRNDFLVFKKIVQAMVQGKHLNKKGMRHVARQIEQMNRKKRSRYLQSSETKRQTGSRPRK